MNKSQPIRAAIYSTLIWIRGILVGKPRLVEVTDRDEKLALIDGKTANDLSTPAVYLDGPKFFCNADELRAWRASQNTSGAKHE